jgi:hypothetical protein
MMADGEDGIGMEDGIEGTLIEAQGELEALRRLRGTDTQAEFAKVWPESAAHLVELERRFG